MFKKIGAFLQESYSELRKVVWPTKDDVVAQTIVVIVSLIVSAAVLGGMDFVSLQLISKIITLGN
jgi:preprotein translocase subunit SecE